MLLLVLEYLARLPNYLSMKRIFEMISLHSTEDFQSPRQELYPNVAQPKISGTKYIHYLWGLLCYTVRTFSILE